MIDMKERLDALFEVYIGKVQVGGQKCNDEVVHMASGLVSLSVNKVKSNSYQCMKLWKGGKPCRQMEPSG